MAAILPRHMFTIIGGDGKEYGPVATDQINAWLAAGRANLQTKVLRMGETEWKTIGDFPEFRAPPICTVPPPPAPAAASPSPAAPGFSPALASRWLRLGAAIIDTFIAGLFVMPGCGMLLLTGVFTHSSRPNPALLIGGIAVIGIGFLLLLAIQIYLLTTRGQTMAKKLLGIKIVNLDDGANPGFVKAFLLRLFVNGLIGSIPFLGVCYSLVDILFIFRDDQRCIHDLIAGTVVVTA